MSPFPAAASVSVSPTITRACAPGPAPARDCGPAARQCLGQSLARANSRSFTGPCSSGSPGCGSPSRWMSCPSRTTRSSTASTSCPSPGEAGTSSARQRCGTGGQGHRGRSADNGRSSQPGVLPPVVSDLPNVPLSVLDLAPIPEGATAGDALRATIDLAQRAERLGYHRFWVAEHHNMPGIASSAPPVLIGHLAGATSTHPRGVRRRDAAQPRLAGRGRAVRDAGGAAPRAHRPGHRPRSRHRPGDGRGAAALPGGALGRRFPRAARRADRLLRAGNGRRATRTRPSPRSPARATARPCGFSGRAGTAPRWPASSGCRSAFAHHFSAENTLPALALYRQRFRPSATLDRPLRHGRGRGDLRRHRRARAMAGRPGRPVVPPVALRPARAAPVAGGGGRLPLHPARPGRSSRSRQASNIVGSAETVRRGLTELLSGQRRRRADDHDNGARPRRPAALPRTRRQHGVPGPRTRRRGPDKFHSGLTARRSYRPSESGPSGPASSRCVGGTHRGARSAAGGSRGRAAPNGTHLPQADAW